MKQSDTLLFDRRSLWALILPLMVEQLLAVLVGLTDSIMVATVGEAGVSGVSLVDNIMILFINVFAAMATGGAVVCGQYLGRGDGPMARRAATQVVWFTTIIALGFTGLIYLCRSFILHTVFGAISPEVEYNANIYLLIVTASIPAVALYSAAAALFRTMGNSKTSMEVSLLMNALNVGGNAILIYGLKFGTAGVAIPTLVSRYVAAIIMVILLLNREQDLYLLRTLRYRPDWELIKRILNIGIPNGLENSMFQLGKILVLSLVSTFGTYAIAANAVSNAIGLFQILPGMAINLAVIAVISRCVGAGEYGQAEYFTKVLLKITYLAQLAVNLLIFLGLHHILDLYNLSELTYVTARKILLWHGVSSFLTWPLGFTIPCTLRAAGDVKVTMMISIVTMWVCRVLLSYFLGRNLGLEVFGVWLAMLIDWIVRGALMIWRYRSGKWKTVRAI